MNDQPTHELIMDEITRQMNSIHQNMGEMMQHLARGGSREEVIGRMFVLRDYTSSLLPALDEIVEASLPALMPVPTEPKKSGTRVVFEGEVFGKPKPKKRKPPRKSAHAKAWASVCPKCGAKGGQPCVSLDSEQRVINYMHRHRSGNGGFPNKPKEATK